MYLEDTIVEGDRKLDPHRPPDPESRPERVGGQRDWLVLVEDAQLDQPVVLPPRPPAGAEGRLADRARHGDTLASPSEEVNVSEPGRVYFGRLWAYPKR